MARLKFLYFILISIVPAGVVAQGPDIIPDSSNALKEIIVTATRKSNDQLSVPYSINQISRSALDQFQYRTTPEALTGSTGLFIQKTNHGGGSVFIRGLTGNQTLLLVDGIRFNNSTFRYGPNQYLNTIDAYTISKIEVARGTGSVQFGSDAMGGIIQVFTKEPSFSSKKEWKGNATAKTFTQNMEYTGRAGLEYQSDKFALTAGLTGRKFGDLNGGRSTGIQIPSGYQEKAFDVKMKLALSNTAVLTLANQFLRQQDVPLYHRVQLENYAYYFFSPQQRNMSYAKLAIEGKNKWVNKIDFITSVQQSLERRNYQKNGNDKKFIEEDKVKTFGATIDVSSVITKSWTSNSGFEYYYDKLRSFKQQIHTSAATPDNFRGLYPDNASSGNISLYSLHHIQLQKWNIEGGLRWNSFAINIPDTTFSALKTGTININPSSIVSNLSLLYNLNNRQSVYASFSTGYRAPNIDDLASLGLVDFRYEIPAYNLKPEKSYNTEFGYRLVTRKAQISAALFYMGLKNLITRVRVAGQKVGGYNVYSKENSQESFIRGAEFSLNCPLSNFLDLKSGVSYLYGQNVSQNEPMRRIPPFNGQLLTAYSKNRWQWAAEALFAGKQYRLARGDKEDNRIDPGGTAGWYILNFFGGYQWKKFSLSTGVQNIFNKDYRTHGSGINGVGRSAWMSAQVNF